MTVATGTTTKLLQRQIMPLDRDFDVLALYIDAEAAILDADKYEIGSNRGAKEMHAAALRQSTSTGETIHPDQIESRTALRVTSGERLSFGTYFNAFPASYWRRWTVVTDVTLTLRLQGHGATVILYKSMANGRSQRVDSATTDEAGAGTFVFDLPLKPFVDGGWYWYDVVAGDEDVIVESAEWTAEVPQDRAEHGTVDIAITTMNRPDFCAKLLGQIGGDDVAAPLPRRGPGDGAGDPEGRRLPGVRQGASRAGLDAAGHRAGQHGRLGRLRPRPARVGDQGHRHLPDVHGRRRRVRARGDHPGRHLRRPGEAPDDRRRAHVQPLLPFAAAQLRRGRPAVAVLVAVRPERDHRLGLRGPQPALRPLAAQADRRRLQRLVHVPDPAPGPGRDRPLPAAVHQVGRRRVRAARQGGRLPHGDLPGCRRVAHPVDRQERRTRLAGVLPPAQPVRRGAAPLAVPPWRADDPGEPEPPDQAPRLDAVLHRRAAPPGASRTCWPAPTPCTPSCR